jgi:hypothetical protein
MTSACGDNILIRQAAPRRVAIMPFGHGLQDIVFQLTRRGVVVVVLQHGDILKKLSWPKSLAFAVTSANV